MNARHQRGMSLVELMVWAALSMLLIAVMGIIYLDAKQLTRVNDSVSRMQENGRFAMHLLEHDLRMAAFRGCNSESVTPVNLLASTAYPYQYETGVTGSYGSGGTWSPSLDASISALTPAPLAGTDVVTVRIIDGAALPVLARMANATADVQIGPASPIAAGDVLLIADCAAATIFNATSFDSGSGAIGHAAGNVVLPGNTSNDLGHVYDTDAAVYRLVTRTYYVATSARKPGIHSLWSYSVPAYDGQAQPEEIVEGVEGVALRFGEDTSGQRAANRYVTADLVGNWTNVVSLRAQILMGTARDGVATSPQPYTFEGVSTTPTDRRVRTMLASLIAIRNRVP